MSVTLEPMPADRYEEWLRRAAVEHASDLVRMGQEADAATQAAAEDLAGYFPEGAALTGHHLLKVRAEDGREVGYLWIGPWLAGGGDEWWVWDVLIDEAERGKGYGYAALLEGEKVAAAHGAHSIGLRVLEFNGRARSLYESLGYETTSRSMSKRLA